MESKLFVAGFPYAMTDEELKTAFSKSGEVVSAKVILDRETGRSRGFGFVEMASVEDADRAISEWNGNTLGGRTINVNVARPREARPRMDDDR